MSKTDTFILRRERMVQKMYHMGIRSELVLQAMLSVPRHLFVEDALAYSAYDNAALPIGLGQTISQPYTVAKMTELLIGPDKRVPKKVLEIGTGCAYQTAVLSCLPIRTIYSIERLPALYEQAQKNLKNIHHRQKIFLNCGDGYQGLLKKAPFDSIIVTAAPKEIPTTLLEQLATGGRLILPLGEDKEQFLWVIEKQEHGFLETCIEKVCFVPLVNSKV